MNAYTRELYVSHDQHFLAPVTQLFHTTLRRVIPDTEFWLHAPQTHPLSLLPIEVIALFTNETRNISTGLILSAQMIGDCISTFELHTAHLLPQEQITAEENLWLFKQTVLTEAAYPSTPGSFAFAQVQNDTELHLEVRLHPCDREMPHAIRHIRALNTISNPLILGMKLGECELV